MYSWTSNKTKNSIKVALLSSSDKIMLAFCALLLIIGVCFGTMITINISGSYLKYITIITDSFFTKRISDNFVINIISSFSSNIIYIFLLFLCGFCAISQPIIILLILFKGLSIGFTISSVYLLYGNDALTYVFIMLLPSMLLNSILFIYCCVQSIKLASYFYTSALKNNVTKKQYLIKEFCVKYIVYSLIIFVFSIADSVILFVFKDYILL